ncbi:sulfurtransferase [Helicovermis profundi]|uniref:Sulfurtransferase n=1 Tax=Helicovermis profundi TaxID=3065157 RepID=A0AAU9E2H3_9FIRM|nr:sulfurtransferase [Clostridia bacterium S502]
MKLLSKKWIILLVVLTVALGVVGCVNKTTYDGSVNIIEVSELKEVIGESNVVVVDARKSEEYAKGHLKGAINLAPSNFDKTGDVGALIADKATIESVLSENGISNDTLVLIYDGSNGVFSSRVWWVLKGYGHENVKVINGGADAIVRNSLELSASARKMKKTVYTAKDFDDSMYASIEDVKNAIEDENIKIIDVRTKAEFDEGAIPTAINYSNSNNCYTDGTFKSETNIFLNYNDLGFEKDSNIILYCKSSYRATQTALLLKEAGFENVKVYDGAWLEWSNSNMPVEEKTDTEVITEQDAS